MSPPPELTTLTIRSDRTKKRERERQSRQRRLAKLEHMRCTVDQLERLALVTRTLEDNDAVWDDFLDDKTRDTRRALIQLHLLIKETEMLQLERTELQRLLTEHIVSTAAIVNILDERFTDNWDAKVDYYRDLVHQHYQPWTLEACHEEMNAALRELDAFQWSTDKLSTNLRILGWREKQRFDSVRGRFQFQFSKDFPDLEIMDCVNATWDAFTHRQTYLETIVKHRQRSTFEILHQLGPNMVIIRIHDRCPGVLGDIHTVYLVTRVRTVKGYLQCVRSLYCPELIRVLSGPHDVWPTNRFWFQWNHLEKGYTFCIGGTMMATDVSYGQNWMVQVFGLILRIEHLATGNQWVTSD